MRIQNLALGVVTLGVALAGQPTAMARQQDAKTTEVLTAAQKAIGGKKLDALKTLSVQAAMQRNVNNFQMNSDIELLIEMPDKYLRTETSSGPMTMAGGSGFNGDRPLRPGNAPVMSGGTTFIRMGPGGPALGPGEKPTPEQQQQMDRSMVRGARQDISRLMLGWFAMAHPSIGAQYNLAGEAESADGKAWVIDVKNADGFAARLFIDEATQLPLMVTYQAPQPRILSAGGAMRTTGGAASAAGTVTSTQARPLTDEERKKVTDDAAKQIQDMQKQAPVMAEYTLFFDDWRDVDGIKFPHRIRRATGGATNEEWTINKVKINPKIDPKKFAIES